MPQTSLCTPPHHYFSSFFFFNEPATTEIYTLSLHDALPIFRRTSRRTSRQTSSAREWTRPAAEVRSEEHTSELQSRGHLVCRLLLEKKKRDRFPFSMAAIAK